MGLNLGKSISGIGKALVNPVGAGIQKLTGLSQEKQLLGGAVIGGGAALAGGAGALGGLGSILPSMIGAAGDIYSARTIGEGQEQANAMNLQTAREQMAFQERMSSTAHQREVEDLKKAGLNPVLSANSGASTPVGSAPDIENAAPNYSGIGSRAIATALQVKQMAKDFEETDSRIALNKSQSEKARMETRAEHPFGAIGDVLARGIRGSVDTANKLDVFSSRLIDRSVRDPRYIDPGTARRLAKEHLEAVRDDSRNRTDSPRGRGVPLNVRYRR